MSKNHTASTTSPEPTAAPSNFIRDIIDADLRSGKRQSVVTRFPPEPNGYLHIGHSKSICLNFGLAREYGGRCHLRFDDTNPTKEEIEYVEAIKHDIEWLGFSWGEHLYHASDYFDTFYACAEHLISNGKAYVDDLTAEEIRHYRGTLTEPGRNSPYRDRPAEESLDLFRRMRAGEFPDGSRVLRAKIDMTHPIIVMRDPTLYRIRNVPHQNTGDKWCIYPMYDYAHPISDALEHVTHSLCTLEFENNRPLYDWVVENTPVPSRPRQIEFARLKLNYTVMSKRKFIQLVEGGHVAGWDDPRMATIAGLRRRGYTPEAIRTFAEAVGVAKRDSVVDLTVLENAIRDDLNPRAPRVLAVLRPLKVVVTNYPTEQLEEFDAPFFPDDPPRMGQRGLPFTRELYIERDDFNDAPPKGYFRLAPGAEVRLRRAYYIRCTDVIKDEQGSVVELHCTYDPESRGGTTPDGRKVKGTIHWVSATHSLPAEVRLYDRLFSAEEPGKRTGDFLDDLSPGSLEILRGARVERSLAEAAPGSRYQFERQGYFVADAVDSKPGALVFNRIVPLKDSWAKIAAKGAGR
jgi:glutaminyl-tRNA synthetase